MSSSPNSIKIKDDSQIKYFSSELLLQSFDKWHTSFQCLLRDRDELRENVVLATQENVRLTEANQKSRNEFDILYNTVKNSNTQLERICFLEEEIRQLKTQSEDREQEIEKLKTQISEERKSHNFELHQTKLKLEEKMIKTTEKIKAEATVERELLQNQLSARERDLEEAEDRIQQIQKNKDAELSRVSLEYENKMARLQRMKVQTNQSQLSSVNSDIYRKKLQNMKAEYESEVSNLKLTIASLEEKLSHTHTVPPMRQRPTLSMEKRKRAI